MGMAQAIRLYLLEKGEASPSDFWRERARDKEYYSVVRVFAALKFLGLIEEAGHEPSSKEGIDKTLYRIVPGMEDHPCWWYLWPCYWDRKGMHDRIPLSYRILGVYPWRR